MGEESEELGVVGGPAVGAEPNLQGWPGLEMGGIDFVSDIIAFFGTCKCPPLNPPKCTPTKFLVGQFETIVLSRIELTTKEKLSRGLEAVFFYY